jgi:hypothetical protein
VHRSDADVGKVERNLRNAVFLNEPTNAFHGFQRTWLALRFAFFIQYNLTCYRVAFSQHAAIFP